MTLKELLFEAYRRNQMGDSFESQKPLERRWLGLGTKSAYRPALEGGYMRFWNGVEPTPRCMGWLVLTEKGITAMQKHESEFKRRLADMRARGYDNTTMANFMLAGGFVGGE